MGKICVTCKDEFKQNSNSQKYCSPNCREHKDIKQIKVDLDEKLVNAEVSVVHSMFIHPRFSRKVAISSYTGYWASAIDYNATAAASGTIRLFSKVRNHIGEKCLYDTTKHFSCHQRNYMRGMLEEKPASDVQTKMMDSMDDFEIVRNHPVIQLFMSANPMQSTYQFLLDIYLQLEITGDAFVYVVSDAEGMMPSQLYVLQSQYVDIIPAEKGQGRLVSHYEYNRGLGETTPFLTEEIIHIKYPNPRSIWHGMGKIEKGWQSVLLNKFSHEYAVALYANHAVPSYILINKSGSSVSKKKFEKSMKNHNKGPSRAGGVMAFDSDMDIKTVAFKPSDMTDNKLTVTEIAAVSGCPLNKLLGNDQVKANSVEQNTSWYRNTVLPMMKLVASTFSEQLLWRYGISDADSFLAFDTPVPADKDFELKTNIELVKNGVRTTNQTRIELGDEPMGPEADVLYFNGTQLGVSPEPVPNITPESPGKTIDTQIKAGLDTIIKQIADRPKASEPVKPIVVNVFQDTIEEITKE